MLKEEYNKSRPRTECPNCGKLITKARFSKHYNACINPNSKYNLNRTKMVYTLDHTDLCCKFCGKELKSKRALLQHEIRCKENANRIAYQNLSNYINEHRKGKSADNCTDIAKQRQTIITKYKNGYVSPLKGKPGTFLGRKHSEESKRLIREHVSKSRKEGYACGRITPAEGVGRGKYSYIVTPTHKYMLRSTYEFIFALYLIHIEKVTFEMEAIRVPAIRPNSYAETFLSDFSVGNTVVEIKGIASGKDYYIKESFEAAGYDFVELFEDSINNLKLKLIEANIDIDSLLKQVVEGHNSKEYFVYDISCIS